MIYVYVFLDILLLAGGSGADNKVELLQISPNPKVLDQFGFR